MCEHTYMQMQRSAAHHLLRLEATCIYSAAQRSVCVNASQSIFIRENEIVNFRKNGWNKIWKKWLVYLYKVLLFWNNFSSHLFLFHFQ